MFYAKSGFLTIKIELNRLKLLINNLKILKEISTFNNYDWQVIVGNNQKAEVKGKVSIKKRFILLKLTWIKKIIKIVNFKIFKKF